MRARAPACRVNDECYAAAAFEGAAGAVRLREIHNCRADLDNSPKVRGNKTARNGRAAATFVGVRPGPVRVWVRRRIAFALGGRPWGRAGQAGGRNRSTPASRTHSCSGVGFLSAPPLCAQSLICAHRAPTTRCTVRTEWRYGSDARVMAILPLRAPVAGHSQRQLVRCHHADHGSGVGISLAAHLVAVWRLPWSGESQEAAQKE